MATQLSVLMVALGIALPSVGCNQRTPVRRPTPETSPEQAQRASSPPAGEAGAAPPTDRASRAPPFGACPPSQTAAHLDDYALTADRQRYWVNVKRDRRTGEWLPTPLPRMPMHHSSRLIFQNLAEFPALVEARDRTLRFVCEQLSHDIEKVAGEYRWRAEYVARIESVCVVDTASGGT